MGVAYTNGPITFTTLRSHTAADMLADIDAVLTGVDWTRVSVTGGYKYTLESPQGYLCKCKITDSGSGYLIVQFVSSDETLQGFSHHLYYGVANYEAAGYQIVANQCQLFISLVGITTQQLVVGAGRNYTVAGGIPYVPVTTGGCAAEDGPDLTVTQIFWSCGNAIQNQDFRNSRVCSNSYCHCLNGTLFIQPAADEMASPDNGYTGGLRLFPLTPTEDVEIWYSTPPKILKYKSGDPLFIDAFIGWDRQIRGQVWDAFQITRDQTLDSILTTTETDAAGGSRVCSWIAWNRDVPTRGGGGTYFATLYLLTTGRTNPVANYAY